MAQQDLRFDKLTAPPEAENLPVQHLAAAFNDTSASYKFFWFLAILEFVKSGKSNIAPIDFLLSHMAAGAWYPVNYFRLSFGKSDALSEVVKSFISEKNIPISESYANVAKIAEAVLRDDPKSKAAKSLFERGRFVPFRFLTPWFANELKGIRDQEKQEKIVALASANFQNHQNLSLYRFTADKKHIEIQPRWFGYMARHLEILESFCHWHLIQFVQKFNPNVPGISQKLFAPLQRHLATAKKFWELAGPLNCIYSGKRITDKSASIDHFLPWSFVTHDLLWNLIPTSKEVNSSKSDSLPSLERYFQPFAVAQYQAFHVVSKKSGVSKILEDYEILFQDKGGTSPMKMSQEKFIELLHSNIYPQRELARNMGFNVDWVYKG